MFLKSKFLGVALATFVALGTSACGADESKAPELSYSIKGGFSVESKDDDTVIKGVTLIGRNGKCPKLTVIKGGSVFDIGTGFIYKDMEACGDPKRCKPLFDGNKLAYGEEKTVYGFNSSRDYENCLPKNGVYKVELDTNFGTYVYEIKAQ